MRGYAAHHGFDEFVELTDNEYRMAVARGSRIYRESQTRKLREYRGFERNGVNGERVQQLGEIAGFAISKALSLPWVDSQDSFKGADLPHNIEARLIGVDWYGLRVYARDDSSRRVVGCVIEKGKEREPYRLPGWIHAIEGKHDEFVIDPLGRGQPVFAVPQARLQPLSVLRDLIREETK